MLIPQDVKEALAAKFLLACEANDMDRIKSSVRDALDEHNDGLDTKRCYRLKVHELGLPKEVCRFAKRQGCETLSDILNIDWRKRTKRTERFNEAMIEFVDRFNRAKKAREVQNANGKH